MLSRNQSSWISLNNNPNVQRRQTKRKRKTPGAPTNASAGATTAATATDKSHSASNSASPRTVIESANTNTASPSPPPINKSAPNSISVSKPGSLDAVRNAAAAPAEKNQNQKKNKNKNKNASPSPSSSNAPTNVWLMMRQKQIDTMNDTRAASRQQSRVNAQQKRPRPTKAAAVAGRGRGTLSSRSRGFAARRNGPRTGKQSTTAVEFPKLPPNKPVSVSVSVAVPAGTAPPMLLNNCNHSLNINMSTNASMNTRARNHSVNVRHNANINATLSNNRGNNTNTKVKREPTLTTASASPNTNQFQLKFANNMHANCVLYFGSVAAAKEQLEMAMNGGLHHRDAANNNNNNNHSHHGLIVTETKKQIKYVHNNFHVWKMRKQDNYVIEVGVVPSPAHSITLPLSRGQAPIKLTMSFQSIMTRCGSPASAHQLCYDILSQPRNEERQARVMLTTYWNADIGIDCEIEYRHTIVTDIKLKHPRNGHQNQNANQRLNCIEFVKRNYRQHYRHDENQRLRDVLLIDDSASQFLSAHFPEARASEHPTIMNALMNRCNQRMHWCVLYRYRRADSHHNGERNKMTVVRCSKYKKARCIAVRAIVRTSVSINHQRFYNVSKHLSFSALRWRTANTVMKQHCILYFGSFSFARETLAIAMKEGNDNDDDDDDDDNDNDNHNAHNNNRNNRLRRRQLSNTLIRYEYKHYFWEINVNDMHVMDVGLLANDHNSSCSFDVTFASPLAFFDDSDTLGGRCQLIAFMMEMMHKSPKSKVGIHHQNQNNQNNQNNDTRNQFCHSYQSYLLTYREIAGENAQRHILSLVKMEPRPQPPVQLYQHQHPQQRREIESELQHAIGSESVEEVSAAAGVADVYVSAPAVCAEHSNNVFYDRFIAFMLATEIPYVHKYIAVFQKQDICDIRLLDTINEVDILREIGIENKSHCMLLKCCMDTYLHLHSQKQV